jgi:hypothetical protein
MSEIIDINSNLHNIFSTKVQNFVKENKDNIKNYFQLNGTISKPNDNSSLSEEKQILYIRNPTEQNNFYLEIYNIAATFRYDNGFFQLINHLNTIVSIFNNKYKEEELEEKKKLFALLFESIEEQDSEKINEIIGFSFDDDQLYDIKSGLDKLVNYFGLENIQIYYESKVNIFGKTLAVTTTTLSGVISGVASGILAGSTIIGTGVGLGIGIIFGIVSYIFIKWNKQRIEIQNGIDNNKVKNNIDKIEDLLYRIKSFYTNNYYKNINVIIVAIDKSKENYNDFVMYGENLKYLNAMDCPKKATPGTNMEYYDICFELMHKFINKYEYMFKNNRGNLEREIKNDFGILKCKKTLPELKNLLDQLKTEEKKPLKNLETSSSNSLLEKKESKDKIYDSQYSISTSNSHFTEIKESNNKNKKRRLQIGA